MFIYFVLYIHVCIYVCTYIYSILMYRAYIHTYMYIHSFIIFMEPTLHVTFIVIICYHIFCIHPHKHFVPRKTTSIHYTASSWKVNVSKD